MRLHFSAQSNRQPDTEVKSHSAGQTYAIGKTLSQLAHLSVRDELADDGGVLRIGSMGRPNMGKSILFEGFMKPLLTPVNVNNRPRMSLYFEKTAFDPNKESNGINKPTNTIGESDKVRTQSFSHSHAAGPIRHYDAELSYNPERALYAYAHCDIGPRVSSMAHVDLVEHANWDEFNPDFDIIVKFVPKQRLEWGDDKTVPRETGIQFFCTEKIARHPIFYGVMEQCKAMARPDITGPATTLAP